MWVSNHHPPAGFDQPYSFDDYLDISASHAAPFDLESLAASSDAPSWCSSAGAAIGEPSTAAPASGPLAAAPAGIVCFVNPWTQQFESFSPLHPEKEEREPEKPQPEPGRPSERRRAQNRAAQRTFKARKQQRERELLVRIGELEKTIVCLKEERGRLQEVLESLQRLRNEQ